MAFIDIPGYLISYPTVFGDSSAAFASDLLDAAAEKQAWIFQVPKTGTIKQIGFLLGTVNQAPVNGLKISLQDVSLSTGDPDGTADQFRTVTAGLTSDTWVTSGILSNDGTDNGTKRAVVQGQYIAVVIEYASFSASDSLNIIAYSSGPYSTGGINTSNQYSDHFTASWTKRTGALNLAIQYTDDEWKPVFGLLPLSAIASSNFATSSTPDEVGIKFTAPVAMRAVGFLSQSQGNIGDYKYSLYDASDNLLASTTLDGTLQAAAGVVANRRAYFDDQVNVELTQDAIYRVTIKPTSETSHSYTKLTIPSSSYMSATPFGTTGLFTSRSDAGAWTDSNVDFMAIGLLIDAIDPVKGGISTLQLARTALFGNRFWRRFYR